MSEKNLVTGSNRGGHYTIYLRSNLKITLQFTEALFLAGISGEKCALKKYVLRVFIY